MKNPFQYTQIVKDPKDFFGHHSVLGDIYTEIEKESNVSVIGPRRIGKSSLLYQLTLHDNYSKCLDKPDAYVFAYIDLLFIAGKGVDDFYKIVVKHLVDNSRGQLCISNEKWDNERKFDDILDKAKDANLKLILCCDEFESLSPEFRGGFKSDESFFSNLRAQLSGDVLTMLTSSRLSLSELCHRGELPTSPLWTIFMDWQLGLMSDEKVRLPIKDRFTNSSMNISDKELGFILELSGCHPCYLQIAGYCLFKIITSTNHPYDLLEVEEEFIKRAGTYYKYAWERLNIEQKEGLLSLINDNYNIDEPILNKLKDNAIVNGRNEISSRGWKLYLDRIETSRPPSLEFDVFMCYNRDNKSAITVINDSLRNEGLNTWIDEDQCKTGTPWKPIIEKQIKITPSSCVFIGNSGVSSWQEFEIGALLNEYQSRHCPVIPVILPNVSDVPDIPFLSQMNWIDLRTDYLNSLAKLVAALKKR